MERLVFVTIKDGPTLPSGRPLRRAVVPVDTTTTFEAFQSVVKKKLRVQEVGSFFSKNGKVSTMAEIMSVDDLEVEEIKPGPSAPVTPVQHRRHVSVEMPLSPAGSSGRRAHYTQQMRVDHGDQNGHAAAEEDHQGKHKGNRAGTQFNLMLQKVGLKPSPGLPVTSDGKDSSTGLRRGNSALRKSMRKGIGGSKGKGKGGRSNISLIVSVSMVLCFFTMIALYYSLSGSQGEAEPLNDRAQVMGRKL